MTSKYLPDETINSVLLSSTSRFVGSIENDSILLTHAWDFQSKFRGLQIHESNPLSRNAFIFCFSTKPVPKVNGSVIPNYAYVGDIICSYLSVFFGKRFDNHGLVQGMGHFHLPDTSEFTIPVNDKLPFNSYAERETFRIPLNLQHFDVFEPIIAGTFIDIKLHRLFATSCKFYLQALQIVEKDPELAYINLITAIEVLSSYQELEKSDLIDEDIFCFLESSRNAENNSIINKIQSQLRSIKKKYIKTIMDFIDDQFFIELSTSEHRFTYTKNNFEKYIKNSYNLRSRYIHTGISFSNWIEPSIRGDDIMVGIPVMEDTEIAKIISESPTFLGLEKIVRYVLLNFLQRNGLNIRESISAKS
jgi:hypothetical protein